MESTVPPTPRVVFWRLVVLIFVLVIGLVVLFILTHRDLLFPAYEFEHRRRFGPFIVYSDVLLTDIDKTMQDVQRRLQTSQTFDPEGSYQVFLCHTDDKYGQFARKVDQPTNTQGFHVHPLGHSFINLACIERMHKRNTKGHRYNILEGNPAHIIAHEIAHQLIEEEMGFWKMRRLPSWKVEGYCEYLAGGNGRKADNAYSPAQLVRDFEEGQYARMDPRRQLYIQGGLAVAYYLDAAGRSLQDLMSNKAKLEPVWAEAVLQANADTH